ncbi:hypothetical protein [Paludisphaera sp.]|uniref:hypothetical protein n=1 Tax=Paludisphaera sp. TaxID=2017432 RepID=UPI00301DCCDF
MPSLRSLARVSVFGIVALAGPSFRSQAVPMTGVQLEGPRHTYTYSTLATFSDGGAIGGSTPSVSFQGIQGQTVESAAPFLPDSYPREIMPGAAADFPLGKLIVTLPAEDPAVYDSARFGITVRIEAVDGVKLTSPITTVLQGSLKGIVNATGESSLRFGLIGESVTPPHAPPGWTTGVFRHAGLTNSILGVSGMSDGDIKFSSDTEIALGAKLMSATPVNTPEPATWAVFSVAILAAWRTGRRRITRPC